MGKLRLRLNYMYGIICPFVPCPQCLCTFLYLVIIITHKLVGLWYRGTDLVFVRLWRNHWVCLSLLANMLSTIISEVKNQLRWKGTWGTFRSNKIRLYVAFLKLCLHKDQIFSTSNNSELHKTFEFFFFITTGVMFWYLWCKGQECSLKTSYSTEESPLQQILCPKMSLLPNYYLI
jgi:hypothetical protein